LTLPLKFKTTKIFGWSVLQRMNLYGILNQPLEYRLLDNNILDALGENEDAEYPCMI